MGFAELRDTLVASVFDELGDSASWNGGLVPVRVRVASRDVEGEYGQLATIQRAHWLRVRVSQVASPAINDVVSLLNADGVATGAALRVTGDPMRGRNGIWTMPVRPI